MALSLEYSLACHCAPALAGIKPADLISRPSPPERLAPLLEEYAAGWSGQGICLRLLGAKNGRSLLLVYRREVLARQLALPEVRRLLEREGYPVEAGLPAMLECLARRLDGPDFPHEVGLFLGYPPADVEGFRRNRGKNFRFSGHWKVYSDVEQARRRFRRYDRCRDALLEKVAGGQSVAGLFARRTPASGEGGPAEPQRSAKAGKRPAFFP